MKALVWLGLDSLDFSWEPYLRNAPLADAKDKPHHTKVVIMQLFVRKLQMYVNNTCGSEAAKNHRQNWQEIISVGGNHMSYSILSLAPF